MQSKYVASFRVLRILRRFGICYDRHHGFSYFFIVAKKRNRITITFAHLAPVNTGNNRDVFLYNRSWENKCFSEKAIEFLRNISRHFQMLFLVLPDRHHIRILDQNISRHQYWIIKSTDIHFLTLRLRILECVRAHQIRHCRDAVENPRKLGYLRHIGLKKKYGLFRVNSDCKIVKGNIIRVLSERGAVLRTCKRVIIRDENKRAILILQVHKLLHCPEVIADMRPPRRFYA